MRLDKYLADMKLGTRSEVKKLIQKGKIKVDGTVIKKADFHVSDGAKVTYLDEEIDYVAYEYYLLNKPKGYYSTLDYSPNVLELIDSRRKDLAPVGRLDKDTEGLILITNDGQMAHKLISPKSHINKRYYVITDKLLPLDIGKDFKKGVDLGDFVSMPAVYEPIDEYSCFLTIQEGKYHQVRRMFEHFGLTVIYLKRMSFSFLELGNLESGEYRELTEAEVEALQNV